MRTLLAAVAVAAVTVSAAFAQPAVRYYNSVPSSRAPAITRDLSPYFFTDGDYRARDPDPGIRSELRRDPPDDR